MTMLRIVCGAVLCAFMAMGVIMPTMAQSVTTARVVSACGTVTTTYTPGGTGPVTIDTNGKLCDGSSSASPSTVVTTPQGATTTTTNSTISVTNTYQAALAASATRKSCTIQNTGTHVELFYFGAIGSATTSNGLQVNAGQTISCATTNGIVLTDAVNITGTAGDGYIVNSQ